MELVIRINLDNAAFEGPDANAEINGVLACYLAVHVRPGDCLPADAVTLRDRNGNRVGVAEIEE